MVCASGDTVTHFCHKRRPFPVLRVSTPACLLKPRPSDRSSALAPHDPGERQANPSPHSLGGAAGKLLQGHLSDDPPVRSWVSGKLCHLASGPLAGVNSNQCLIFSFSQRTLVDVEIMTEFENQHMYDE